MLWLISHCKVVTCACPATPTPTVAALSAPLTMKPLSVAPVALNMPQATASSMSLVLHPLSTRQTQRQPRTVDHPDETSSDP
ncbi:unnamed protein product [Malus baccata var. baccata]